MSEDRSGFRIEERNRTVLQWQERWAQDGPGAWFQTCASGATAMPWARTTFHATQFLTGHGSLRGAPAGSRQCMPVYCSRRVVGAEHAVFRCERLDVRRLEVLRLLGAGAVAGRRPSCAAASTPDGAYGCAEMAEEPSR